MAFEKGGFTVFAVDKGLLFLIIVSYFSVTVL